MAKPASSHVNLDMPKDAPPTASSHNAVEHSPKNESGGTSVAAAAHSFCFSLCSFIFIAVRPLIILLVQFIWYLYWLLSRLMFIKDVNDRKATAKWRVRILLLLLLSLVIVVSIPGLKLIKVLGLPLWKWMVMVALVILSYHYISVGGQSIANKWKETAVAYYVDGLRRSGSWFMFCIYILLAWELYFRSPRHGLRQYGVSKKVHHIGTSLAISLLVGASLALVKNWLILLWESHTIFRRCTPTKIKKVGEQLYFLGLYGSRLDLFSRDEVDNIYNSSPDNDKEELSNYVKKKAAEYFITMAKKFPREDNTDERIPKSISTVWEKFKEPGSDNITKESMKEKFKEIAQKKFKDDKLFENDTDVFFNKLKKLKNEDESKDKEPKNTDELKDKESKKTDKPKGKETKDKEPKNADEPKNTNEPEEKISEGQDSASTDKIRYKTFKHWMKNAFIDCVSFGYTLVDTRRAKNKLDIIITVFLVIVAFLCFLFLAGIASAKVLVTIWTSFAAAAFILGDMLKALFEGIIFVFVMHPFSVGDLCIIDDTQLEVNSIDVLNTTFHRIDNEDEVLYPNKVLAGKTISNLKWKLIKKDYVELNLRTPVGINTLEHRIEGFFDEYSHEFEKPHVLTKEIGEFIKIAIHFKHIIQDDTHVQYSKKKKEQRSKLLREVLDHIETKESSSTNNTVESSGQKTRETASSSTKNTTESSGQRTFETASSSTKNMAESLG